MSKPEQGFLLIADITGYTIFLSQSELEHAKDILQTLLELLIRHTKPPLVISRLAGDAVISYGLQDNFFSGQTFVEMIEDTYVAFRQVINLMVLNNTCQCNACANISNLDLKFFVHHGSFIRQRLDRHDELLGEDVILIHRLLKNHITQEKGVRAYTLYTSAALRNLGLNGFEAEMITHRETYEHLGEIQVWVQDMHHIWEATRDLSRIAIAPDDVLAFTAAEFPLSVARMWDVVTAPEYRAIFVQSVRQEIKHRRNGRIASGSIYECFHGNGQVTRQTILEWLPFEQPTTQDQTPVPDTTVLLNLCLTPTERGTLVAFTCSKARGKWPNRVICDLMGRFVISRQFRNGMRELAERLEAEAAEGRHGPAEAVDLPDAEVGAAVEASLSGGVDLGAPVADDRPPERA